VELSPVIGEGLVSPHRGDHLVELLPVPGEVATWSISFWRPDLNFTTAGTNTISCAPAADHGPHI
ncbi:TPA: hypothetical protein ACP2M1_004681, partial [Escherichia coli]